MRKGAYIVEDCSEPPELIFYSNWLKVSLAIETCKLMKDKNIRVVSMPCVEIYENQDEYQTPGKVTINIKP